jgi:D-glycero-D-manno-heptose 1,7-bisphosphate phosphatase
VGSVSAAPCCYHSRVSHPANSIASRILHTVFLDRDGVINRKLPEGSYVTSQSQFEILPGVIAAIAKLNRAGLRVVVVTNQRGIALELYTAADVLDIHAAFQRDLHAQGASVDAFYFCPHDKAQCDCRKPLPGLFHQAVAEFHDITPESSAILGDSWSDIEFGRRLGMFTVFIEGDATHRKPGSESARDSADASYASLPEAVDAIVAALHSASQ